MLKRKQGFTIIELLVVLGIVVILVSITYPLYQTYIYKSHRTDAMSTLLALQLAEEKYHFNHSTYGTLNQVWNGSTTSLDGYYTLSITKIGTSTYTVVATAMGEQLNDKQEGISCATMQIVFDNGIQMQLPAACWQ